MKERRTLHRVPVDIPATASGAPGRLTDLSTAGACLALDNVYREGTELTIRFGPIDGILGKELALPAMVMWSDGKKHGLFFIEIEDDDLGRLAHAVDELEKEEE